VSARNGTSKYKTKTELFFNNTTHTTHTTHTLQLFQPHHKIMEKDRCIITYRFQSSKIEKSLTMPGGHAKLFDIKRQIVRLAKMDKGTDLELEAKNADTLEGNFC